MTEHDQGQHSVPANEVLGEERRRGVFDQNAPRLDRQESQRREPAARLRQTECRAVPAAQKLRHETVDLRLGRPCLGIGQLVLPKPAVRVEGLVEVPEASRREHGAGPGGSRAVYAGDQNGRAGTGGEERAPHGWIPPPRGPRLPCGELHGREHACPYSTRSSSAARRKNAPRSSPSPYAWGHSPPEPASGPVRPSRRRMVSARPAPTHRSRRPVAGGTRGGPAGGRDGSARTASIARSHAATERSRLYRRLRSSLPPAANRSESPGSRAIRAS